VVDCVGDIAAIADQLGIERFAVSGGSGGGPHALAAAARLPERVTRAQSNVGIAPYDADGLDFFDGMDPANVEEVEWALGGEERLVPELEQEARRVLAQLDDDPAALLSGFELAEADRTVLQDEVVQERIKKSMRDALAPGVWGWVDDDLAFVKPWGFDVGEISVPVQIRYGAHDVLVPTPHGEWLSTHIRGATAIVNEASGHMATPDQHLEQLLEFLAA
jgi:pimeloyl-ACP methyl ester carboxylesterase